MTLTWMLSIVQYCTVIKWLDEVISAIFILHSPEIRFPSDTVWLLTETYQCLGVDISRIFLSGPKCFRDICWHFHYMIIIINVWWADLTHKIHASRLRQCFDVRKLNWDGSEQSGKYNTAVNVLRSSDHSVLIFLTLLFVQLWHKDSALAHYDV